MARTTCFRCDWEGDADGAACPRCGTPLYRARPAAPRADAPARDHRDVPTRDAAPTTPAAVRPTYLSSSEAHDPAAPQAVRRGRPFAVFVALAALVTGGLWWFLRAHEVPEAVGSGTSPPPSGRLVYTTGEAGGQRLWTWDPGTETLTQGPFLDDEVVHLVSAQGALAGWLGVTTRDGEGLLEASILRTQTPDAHAAHVSIGDLVAWGPNGASVVSAGLGSVSNGCYANLTVSRERLDLSVREPVFRRSRFCGEIPTLGQTLAATYFTWEREDETGVFFVGNGDAHETLGGWFLLSASPTSDLLVRPAGGSSTQGGAALFWHGAAEPDPYRGAGGGPVVVERVLTWTIGADEALVVATVDGRGGLYLLDTTPGGDRVPRYVGIVHQPVFATAAFDGSLYVAMDGRLLARRDERLAEVDLPEGAPRPTGPLAWMPG
jgi:hypothetical protein